MAERRLHVLVDGEHAGLLVNRSGALRLAYDDDYRTAATATPVSCSLPLSLELHTGAPVRAFIEGLLPDSEPVRRRWAEEFRVKNAAFDLLAHVGEDCAGAVQFVREERLGSLAPGEVHWLDDGAIADWIEQLRVDPAGWLREYEFGQFSLAGAQSKFALLRQGGKWGRPSGALATTHILKPASDRFPGHEVNEHLTLSLARAVGLAVARSEVVDFDGQRVVVVERYDRYDDGSRWRRVHQEDLCQAVGKMPEQKYEVNGGPGIAEAVSLIRTVSTEPEADVDAFLDAVLFNWVTANTDAHAKNYSLLLAGRDVRLAPLYDLASVLPYLGRQPGRRSMGELHGERLRLAMSVDGTYALAEVRRRDWEAVFSRVGLVATRYVDRAEELMARIEAELPGVVEPAERAFGGPMPDRFLQSITSALSLRRAVLAGRPARGRRR